MRLLYLIIFWISSVVCIQAQSYYVAVVKGKVYYEDKLLKKKDKIKMKGVLRFTSKDDYVKFSGPGGLYTLDPGIDSESDNEFLVAVKEEFFPKIRTLSTSENDIVIDPNYYFNQRGFRETFLDKTHFHARVPDLNTREELGYLHETDQGLFYKTAIIEDSLLTIRKQDFSFIEESEPRPRLIRTAIVMVTDKQKWLKLIQDKDGIDQIHGGVTHYGLDSEPPPEDMIDPTTGKMVNAQQTSPAEILDYMGPPTFVKREIMAEDLRFHLRACKAKDIETFLEVFGYQEYIEETFGDLREMDIIDVLKNELKLE